MEEIQKLYNIGENIICKFEIEVKKGTKYGSGFFFEIDDDLNISIKKALFTYNHVLPEKILKEINYLEFKYEGDLEIIKIENSKIYSKEIINDTSYSNTYERKIFTDKNLDYTCIELLENDDIFRKLESTKLFTMKKNISIENLKNSNIFILQFPQGDDLSFSMGEIDSIQDSIIGHTASTEGGSSGSPIISRSNIYSILGIHFGGSEKLNINCAHLMKNILEDIKRQYNYKVNDLKINKKTLNDHTNYVNNIIVLNDGRLCSCSSDQKMIIYNKNYEIDLTIKDNCNIYYHSQLSNNDLISCCKDNTLKIYNLYNVNQYSLIQTLKSHEKPVLKVIEVNDKLISCAFDKTVKIWEKDLSNIYFCSKTLYLCNYNNSRLNVLKTNDQKFVCSISERHCLKFFFLLLIILRK